MCDVIRFSLDLCGVNQAKIPILQSKELVWQQIKFTPEGSNIQ